MRPRKCRFIGPAPAVRYYKPQGVPFGALSVVTLRDEEFEAILLTDHEGLDQETAAAKMRVSRPTFSRILAKGRSAVARALANGDALRIGGGDYRRPSCATPKKEGKKMKILITSTGRELGAPLDPRFGRAPYFLVYDTESTAITTLDNKGACASGSGAGIKAADLAARAGAQAVLTGRCGPKAYAALRAAGVRIYYTSADTGSGALEEFLAGALPEARE